MQTLDLVDLVAEAMAGCADEAAWRGASLDLEAPTRPLVVGVRRKLARVVINLVTNALDASPVAGRVLVRVDGDGRCASVEVQDEGAGVPDEMHELVFEPFVSTREDGAGLGLALARQVARAHGGEVALVAGPGCRVRLQLPQARGRPGLMRHRYDYGDHRNRRPAAGDPRATP